MLREQGLLDYHKPDAGPTLWLVPAAKRQAAAAIVAAAGLAPHAGGPAVLSAGGAAAAAAGDVCGIGAAQHTAGGGQLDALRWPLPLSQQVLAAWGSSPSPATKRRMLQAAEAILLALQVRGGSACVQRLGGPPACSKHASVAPRHAQEHASPLSRKELAAAAGWRAGEQYATEGTTPFRRGEAAGACTSGMALGMALGSLFHLHQPQ